MKWTMTEKTAMNQMNRMTEMKMQKNLKIQWITLEKLAENTIFGPNLTIWPCFHGNEEVFQ